jgi:hypothetical protein
MFRVRAIYHTFQKFWVPLNAPLYINFCSACRWNNNKKWMEKNLNYMYDQTTSRRPPSKVFKLHTCKKAKEKKTVELSHKMKFACVSSFKQSSSFNMMLKFMHKKKRKNKNHCIADTRETVAIRNVFSFIYSNLIFFWCCWLSSMWKNVNYFS